MGTRDAMTGDERRRRGDRGREMETRDAVTGDARRRRETETRDAVTVDARHEMNYELRVSDNASHVSLTRLGIPRHF